MMRYFTIVLAGLLLLGEAAVAPRAQQNDPLEQLLKTCQRQISGERFELAYKTAREALDLSRKQNDKKSAARATSLLAVAAFHTNRTNEAIRYFKQAAVTADDAGMQRIQATALSHAGALLRMAGRYEDALYCATEALRLYRQFRGAVGEILMLGQIGGIYGETGDYSKAEPFLREGLSLAEQRGLPDPQATILTRLLIVERGRGDLTAAMNYGRRAEALIAPREVNIRKAEIYYEIGKTLAELGQHAKATAYFRQALQMAMEYHAPQYAAVGLGALADSLLKSGNPTAALESVATALKTLRRGGGSKYLETRFLATRAEALRALGKKRLALAAYRESLAALEQARAYSIPTEVSRAGIVASRHQVFVGAIDLMLELGLSAEAFDVAEAYHARAFLDVLAESGVDAAGELSPAQQEQEDRLFEAISSVQRKLWQGEPPPEQKAQLERQLAEAEEALDLFRMDQRRADPRYARMSPPRLLTSNRVSTELLAADSALIEFVLGEKQSYAWVIAREKAASVALPPGRELADAVTAFRTASIAPVSSATAAQAIAKLRGQGAGLYQKLIQPLEPHLNGIRRLVIVTDGAMAYLPFEMLVGQPHRPPATAPYLVERFAISYAPSASALAALRAARQTPAAEPKGFLAFADPMYEREDTPGPLAVVGGPSERGNELRRLPYTRHEVNEIAALFSPAERRVFLGADANEAAVKAEPLQQYRYVHFAAHALIDEDRPVRSGIWLSLPAEPREDGALQVSEVMRLKLNADLVSLSACRTGLGQLLRGEGMVGLTRAFLYAGADSVTVSLWDVNDIATASLMKGFYKNLQQRLPRDEALRQAKLGLIRGAQQAWRHPYYWAPFVLMGDSR